MADARVLPIGIDNFEKIRKCGFFYVDKKADRTAIRELGSSQSTYASPRRKGVGADGGTYKTAGRNRKLF